ncbi:aroma-sacti cluster domain-containing protein [Streptomyces sp. NPDC059743]|uniref:aroma-sacti cluster domain-containing protein n=1 Tax=Streptomyces sp. NPDC059743 TaxID=3346928 RepID=UPI003669FC3A
MNEPEGPRPGRPDRPGQPAPDALAALEEHGFPLSELTDEQRQVLRGLTPDEVFLLLDIKARLDEVGPEVQAHSEIAGGALF